MVFISILRKSPSVFAAFGSRLVRAGQGNYNTALFAALSHRAGLSQKYAALYPFSRYYSTAAETRKPSSAESLLRVIESEIKVAQDTDQERVEEIPKGFLFKIEDNVGQQTIMLTREYDGELVKVEVYMPDLVTGEQNDVDDDNDDIEKPSQSSIPLVVTVSKKSGSSLEFSCLAYPDEIAIDSLSVKSSQTSENHFAYEGPSFQDLDENLRNAFHKYLEIRGIKPSVANFLQEYMINKDSREYLCWLKNLKKFVEA